jgi:dolichol-phosphate mannosyltransferase
MSSVLIVIPTFNESKNIALLIDGIMQLKLESDIMVVDDNSPDGTADTVRTAQKKYDANRIHLLVRSEGKAGRGSAVLAGFQYARENGYDTTIEMDADLSHDPKDIPRLLEKLSAADVVIGSKYIQGGRIEGLTWNRVLLSKVANLYTRTILRLPISDYTNGFRCYGPRALALLPELKIDGVGFTVIPQMSYQLHHKGMTFAEVPIVFINRRHGTSNMGPNEILESVFAILKIRSNSLYIHAKQMLKFGTTGLVNAVMDLGTLAFCVEILNLPLRISVCIAGLVAISVAFLINKHWTFRNIDKRYMKQYMGFLCVYGSSFILGIALTLLFAEILGLWYILARILVMPIAAFWNYLLLHKTVFR